MSFDSIDKNQENYIHFSKLKFWSNVADSFANYGVQCGVMDFMDQTDLNCGALPEGSYEQVIDLSAPEQFLSLYTQIAESRFAFVVTNLLKLSEKTFVPMQDFLYSVGKSNQVQNLSSAREAFDFVQSFLVDGMPGTESIEIIEEGEEFIQWKKISDTHKSYWEKFGGSVENYYSLQHALIDGLLTNTQYCFINQNNESFTILKVEKICYR